MEGSYFGTNRNHLPIKQVDENAPAKKDVERGREWSGGRGCEVLEAEGVQSPCLIGSEHDVVL